MFVLLPRGKEVVSGSTDNILHRWSAAFGSETRHYTCLYSPQYVHRSPGSVIGVSIWHYRRTTT
ncbi:hypothetical protein BDN67DRAFT_659854 [Paxillus ammoniavirescens]|nr:hypothetical protein BDN67DRAFT_659854 [Paxillus ammoniavirescens]